MDKNPFSWVLIADDDPENVEILREVLHEEGYSTLSAENGASAMMVLESNVDRVGAVLLDRAMPIMGGMEVLANMKKNRLLSRIPVIFQTARAIAQERLDGLLAGAWQYITKPYRPTEILVAVRAALAYFQEYKKLENAVQDGENLLLLMTRSQYEFSTLEEALLLAGCLARTCSDPHKVSIGLWELMVNAIEHGNLGISYDEKKLAIQNGQWDQTLNDAFRNPTNQGKKATIQYDRISDKVSFLIKDMGAGFDWKKYMDFDPNRAFDPNGRGVAMARSISFETLTFRGNGNEVQAVTPAIIT